MGKKIRGGFRISQRRRQSQTGTSIPVADLGGAPNSFNFMQFFGKIWQNRMLAPPPPPGVGVPPRGNPGFATESTIWPIFIENCMKMKKNRPKGWVGCPKFDYVDVPMTMILT